MIDLDHNATTPLDPRVRGALAELRLRDDLGNPSSQHRRGRAARAVVENARRRVAKALDAEPLGVTWTSGGTEADNLAIDGIARALQKKGRPSGVLVSPLEHPAVAAAAARLRHDGYEVVALPVGQEGTIEPPAVADTLRQHPHVGLVSIAAANHELGNAYDVAAIAEAVRGVRPDVVVHADAVQAVGRVEVSLAAWGVDALSVSGHKLGGPAGVGALVHRRQLSVLPVIAGGGQERGRRGGTESTSLIHGFGLAVQLAVDERELRAPKVSALRRRLLEGLLARGARVAGDPQRHTGNTINAAFEGCPGELVMMNLDLAHIAVSTGAACSSGSPEPSPVLLALGVPPVRALEAVRFSLSHRNTEAEIDATLDALDTIVPRVRKAARQ